MIQRYKMHAHTQIRIVLIHFLYTLYSIVSPPQKRFCLLCIFTMRRPRESKKGIALNWRCAN